MSSNSTITSYREQTKFLSAPEKEEKTSSSSSTGDEPRPILGVVSSPSSDYLIYSYIGEGAFGKVANCLKTATQEIVAVKIIKGSNMTTEARNEVAAFKKLRAFDPDRFNFVRYNDAFMCREHVCIEFEMLDMSLLDFLHRKPERSLTVKEIRPILYQMATTLLLLQNQGIVHTDLKPDNIMLVDHVKQPLKIKVIDFGLAHNVQKSGRCSYLQPRFYRSPEVILGLAYTSAIDMWSLGCVAAELFLGCPLFPGSSEYNMLQHITRTRGRLPQKLLNDGTKTKFFFQQKKAKKRGRKRWWTLKTPYEYGKGAETESYFKSLSDLLQIRPPCHLSDEDTRAEVEDREQFVDLLTRMLHVDADKRTRPSQLLQDPFISMKDLADNCPSNFYFKCCCETMEVCRGEESHNVVQDDAPAWQSCWEHPLILEAASSFSSSLSFHENSRSPQSWQLSSSDIKGWTPSGPQSFLKKQAPSSDDAKPVRKRKTHNKSPESTLPEKKKTKKSINFGEAHTEGCCNPEDAQTEASPSTAKAKPQRRTTRATFAAAQTGGRNPEKKSPERKRMSMDRPPSEAASEVRIKPQRKRLRDTADAQFGNRSPEISSPEMRMEAAYEVLSSEVRIKRQRKRTWDIFAASQFQNRSPHKSSPEKKKRKVGERCVSQQVPPAAASSQVTTRLQRKRTWDTFAAAQFGDRCLDSSSPERKRRKKRA